MIEHQIHFNRKFYQDKKTGYWISTDSPKIRAHRWVWINYHGTIPNGYHIHHRNEDKSDNRIENLELIERSRHYRHHYTEEKREWSRHWVSVIRPLTKAWHASEEGSLWHKYHAKKNNFGNWEPISYICQVCDKEYLSKKRSNAKFCTNNCKSKYRRDSGLDNVENVCVGCAKSFIVNKYSKQKYCSRQCSSRKMIGKSDLVT